MEVGDSTCRGDLPAWDPVINSELGARIEARRAFGEVVCSINLNGLANIALSPHTGYTGDPQALSLSRYTPIWRHPSATGRSGAIGGARSGRHATRGSLSSWSTMEMRQGAQEMIRRIPESAEQAEVDLPSQLDGLLPPSPSTDINGAP